MNAPLKPQTRFLLEDTGGVGYFFDAPSSYWEARNVDEVSGALRQIEEACRQGQHVLGLFPYELGLALQDLPTRHPSDGVLLRAWVFPRLRTWSSKDIETFLTEATSSEPPSGFAGLQSQIDVMTYGQTVNQIHQAIREGETYQLNFTFPWRGSLYGSPLSVYRRLRERQPGPYSAYLEWESGWVLSHSPESFIEHQAGTLTCRPMKGTSDREGGSELSQDPKNQSENVMIVDLIRNDLSRIALPDSVEVSDLFKTHAYGEVTQMTSTITARLDPVQSLESILRAMFPCGSVTGAPKRRTMEWIDRLEDHPRGLYCGSIGWFKPCEPNVLPDFHLSVAIRTLEVNPERQVILGVGSGITIESQADQEWDECQLKASFATRLPSSVGLIETMRCELGQIKHRSAHLKRLEGSARALGILFCSSQIEKDLEDHLKTLDPLHLFRVRLELNPNGEFEIHSETLAPLEGPIDLMWASTLGYPCMSSKNLLLGHKTTDRLIYDRASEQALQHGAFDALFVNEHGFVTEGGRSNLFVRLGQEWKTPPLTDGVLPGIQRELLIKDCSYEIEERSLTIQDVLEADEVWITNSLRGKLVVRGFRS